MDSLFKDDCIFVNSKLRWDQRISVIFASEKGKEKVTDLNYMKSRDKIDDKDLDTVYERDEDRDRDRDKEKKDEDIRKDKKEREKSSDAVSIKVLRESLGLLVTLSKVITAHQLPHIFILIAIHSS